MTRATAAETADRIDALQMKLLVGEPNAECLTFARQQWGGVPCSGLPAVEACLGANRGRHNRGGRTQLQAGAAGLEYSGPVMAAALGRPSSRGILVRWWRASGGSIGWSGWGSQLSRRASGSPQPALGEPTVINPGPYKRWLACQPQIHLWIKRGGKDGYPGWHGFLNTRTNWVLPLRRRFL